MIIWTVTAEESIRGMDGEDILENPPDWEEVLERQRDGEPDVEEDEESYIVEPLMRQVPLSVD